MDKKDIYEHLAKIYLDASLKGKDSGARKKTFSQKRLRFALALALVFFSFSLFLFARKPRIKTEVALVINPDLVRINFHFDPAKKEIYSLDLNQLDLSHYRYLSFDTWRSQFEDNVYMRVEFANNFQERSEVYLKDIPHKRTHYKIPLAKFSKIHDWQKMRELSFVIEEWNTKSKKGIVFIDNVKFLR